MIFCTNSKIARIQLIVHRANELLNSERFKFAMANRKAFHSLYTSSICVSGTYVWMRLVADPARIEVLTYRSLNPFTKSNGYTKDDGKTQIFLNTRKFNRTDASIMATLFHEAVHEADNNDKEHFYHHGDNEPKGGTAPEVVADIVYELESGRKSVMDSSVHRKPWWKFWR